MNLNKFSKQNIEPVLIIILIILLVNNTKEMFDSRHNIDLSYNVNILECYINTLSNQTTQISDTGSDYVSRPIKEYYIMGMNGISNSYIWAIIYSIFLGILIMRKLNGGKMTTAKEAFDKGVEEARFKAKIPQMIEDEKIAKQNEWLAKETGIRWIN